MTPTNPDDIIHATTVALNGRAVVIMGPSGAGKSGLALELMAYGADLVADDRTRLVTENGRLIAQSAPNLHGMIEARGFGILHADAVDRAEVVLVVDLEKVESERLPPRRSTVLLDVTVPLVHKSAHSPFSAAILQYLKFSGKE